MEWGVHRSQIKNRVEKIQRNITSAGNKGICLVTSSLYDTHDWCARSNGGEMCTECRGCANSGKKWSKHASLVV